MEKIEIKRLNIKNNIELKTDYLHFEVKKKSFISELMDGIYLYKMLRKRERYHENLHN